MLERAIDLVKEVKKPLTDDLKKEWEEVANNIKDSYDYMLRTLNDPKSDAVNLYTVLTILIRINEDLSNRIARIDILTKTIENIDNIIKKEMSDYVKSIGKEN